MVKLYPKCYFLGRVAVSVHMWSGYSGYTPNTLNTAQMHPLDSRCNYSHNLFMVKMADNGPKWPNIAGEVAAPLALTSEVVAILCMRRFWSWDKVLNQDDR